MTPSEISLWLEYSRSAINARGFDLRESNGQTLYCYYEHNGQLGSFAFRIGRKGSPIWDEHAWVKRTIDVPERVTPEKLTAMVESAIERLS